MRDVRGGLTFRLVVASAVLAVVVAVAFAVLLSSVGRLRDLQQEAGRSGEVLVGANHLEKLVVDLEAGQRGFIITAQEAFLDPWTTARAAIPGQVRELAALVADNPTQLAAVRQIDQTITSYLDDYSIPLLNTTRTNPAAARTIAVTQEGKARIETLRADFDRFGATETTKADQRQAQAAAADHRASVAAAFGLAGSLALVVAFGAYLTCAIARPVRRAAVMAGRIAGGDLDVQLPGHGPGEVGVLERSFNTMAASMRRNRAELAASRARIVAAGDQARRRIERDLHDGIQQRLVSLVLDLRTVEAELPEDNAVQAGQVADGLAAALDELRELSRGIHPAILSEGGLGPALKALARRSPVPVELDLDVPQRPAEPVEVAAYYVVSEALANAAKHAEATVVTIEARSTVDRLCLRVHDDGVGGASPTPGSGLAGLVDRVEALGGTLKLTSPPGDGTELTVELPLLPAGAAPGDAR
ncbi:CHASE3 domain-containing protein [Amycolatopsis sp. NBC_01488]|uniref:CHASE3 domain-containing protein n=1 Tax=Amycolatopsis sp. NBC_01488 TaxID=2903563 RepID=UPI002E285C8B|nr:CHASE3 domain-containing protein [Amycolatopsis sp. NBC_01488]